MKGRQSVRRFAAVCATVLLVSGCALGGGDSGSQAKQTRTPGISGSSQGRHTTGDDSRIPALGGVTLHAPRNPYVQVRVASVQRTSYATVVQIALTNTGSGKVDLPVGFNALALGSRSFEFTNVVSNLRIIDPATLTAYAPMGRTADNECLCSNFRDSLAPKETVKTFAAFPPLAPSAEKVRVWLAPLPPIEGVPVTQAQPSSTKVSLDPYDAGERMPLPTKAQTKKYPVKPAETLEVFVEKPDRRVKKDNNQVEVGLEADVLFDTDSAKLRPKAHEVLADAAKKVNKKATGTVKVVGYTDSRGSDSYNKKLSRRRARAVADALKQQVTANVTFKVSGKGEGKPVASNDTKKGRQANRRVEITYSTS